jgi:hypothetical protein
MRAAYLRATHMSTYAMRRWQVTGRTPDELLDGALAELERPEAEQGNPHPWRNRLELAALAQYHMAAYEVLKREPMGRRDADQRGPQKILALMLQDERGFGLLPQPIIDGRAGVAPRLVDQDGQLVHGLLDDDGDVQLDPDGPAVPPTDRWLRYDCFPTGGQTVRPVSIRPETPTMKASRLQQHVLQVIEQLAKTPDELDHLEAPSGGALLEHRGWPASDIKNAVGMLIDAQSKFGYWGQVAAQQATRSDQLADAETDEDLDEETSTIDVVAEYR